MSSSNPFDDGDDNPFFETVKTKSPIDEDVVFGGASADEPVVQSEPSAGAPMPEMAVPSGAFASMTTPTTTASSSTGGAIMFDGDDSEEESKPINFDDEQSKGKGKDREMQEVGFSDKAISAAEKLLFESNDDDDDGAPASGEGQKPKRKWYNFWKPSFYQPYFDVDTKDVLLRCLAGIIPFGKPFFERVEGNPDLYGPFWITTTILFLLAISSNFAEYIAYLREGVSKYWQADFYKVSIAAAVFYAYLIILPIIIWALQRFMVKAKLTLFQVICVYGYSLTAFLIATPFCIFPVEWVRWLVTIIACVFTCMCISVALFKSLSHDKIKGIIVIIVAVVFLVALALTYKVYFFSKVTVPASLGSSSF